MRQIDLMFGLGLIAAQAPNRIETSGHEWFSTNEPAACLSSTE
jgi:hypothetical protein